MRVIWGFFLMISGFGFSQNSDSLLLSLNKTPSFSERFAIPSSIDSLWQTQFLDPPINDHAPEEKLVNDKDFVKVNTDTLKKRLTELNAKTPLAIEYTPILERLINTYLKERKSAFEHLLGLSQYYFPIFEDSFDKQNVPLEIKYLAVVESMLKPNATSPVGAKGLWQFMFSTAKQYDLEVSSYVDERCDPIRSSQAAANYLKDLYLVFNDWNLAMAAYNSGPGNVTKAMRRSGGHSNYWNIRPFLPKETADYLPKFLATMYIFEYAEAHGIYPKKFAPKISHTDTILVKEMIGFDHLEKAVEVDRQSLEFLNPSYKVGIIPVLKNRNYSLRLPKNKIGLFVDNESQIYAYAKHQFNLGEKPLPKFFKMDSKIRYKIKSGDYLGKIAKKFRVRVSDIKRWNNMKSDQLRAGQRITIYTRNVDYNEEKEQSIASQESASSNTYLVQKGDSLWSIAQKFSGISVENLKQWNGISGSELKPGMRLVISNN